MFEECGRALFEAAAKIAGATALEERPSPFRALAYELHALDGDGNTIAIWTPRSDEGNIPGTWDWEALVSRADLDPYELRDKAGKRVFGPRLAQLEARLQRAGR